MDFELLRPGSLGFHIIHGNTIRVLMCLPECLVLILKVGIVVSKYVEKMII